MPFSSTDSLTSTNMNNMLRGLYRDNADHALTGTLTETTAGSTSLAGGTIGATGTLIAWASGTSSGAGGVKNPRFYLGATTLSGGNIPAGTLRWYMELKLVNTASNAQRYSVFVCYDSGSGASMSATTILSVCYGTAAVDTSTTQTFTTSLQLANTGDTITQSTFNVLVAQIT